MTVDAFPGHSVAAVYLMDFSSFLHQSNALFPLLINKAFIVLFLNCLVHISKMWGFFGLKKKCIMYFASSINSKEFFFVYLKTNYVINISKYTYKILIDINALNWL